MKLLLTGGTGLLGTSLTRSLPETYNTTITYVKNAPQNKKISSIKMDLSDPREIKEVLKKTKPQIIIHAAAATDIEWCEKNPKEAFSINSFATEIISKEADSLKAKVIYISTDFVFDGEKGNYNEEDMPNPLNVYGKTKLMGEEAVLKYTNNLVIRTNIYGIDPLPTKQSFASWVISSLRSGKEILTATDQIYNPIFADQLSGYIFELIGKNQAGVWNIACLDKVNRYQFASLVSVIFGLDKNLIKQVKLQDLINKFGWKAKRPKDTSLDVSKAGKTFKLPTVKASLEAFKNAIETDKE